jgi:hypothetical protein
MNVSSLKNEIKSIEIHSIGLIITFYLFRTTLPVFKVPFIFLVLCLIAYSVIKFRFKIFSDSQVFIRTFILVILLAIFLSISFFLSNKLYYTIFVDVINAAILIFLFFIMTVFLRTRSDLFYFFDILIRYLIIFSLLIAFALLCNFFNIIPYSEISSAKIHTWTTFLGSISVDYNFSLIPILFGMASVLYQLLKSNAGYKKGLLNSALFIYVITIFLSGSRRGIISLLIIVFFLALIQVIFIIWRSDLLEKLAKSSRLFLSAILILVFLTWSFTYKTSYSFKKNTLEFIGSKNQLETKMKFALTIYKYNYILNKDQTFLDIYERIWYNGFDKRLDPDSGWGISEHKTIFALTGDNAEIIPIGALGYLLDSTCNSSTWNGDAYSYTLIGNENVMKGDSVLASVYCYLSKDFDGSWAQLSAEGSTIGNRVSQYFIPDSIAQKYYDADSVFKKVYYKGDTLNFIDNNFYGHSGVKESGHIDGDSMLNNDNLIINGNFSNGSTFWLSNADSTKNEIIDTPFGKGMRVSRTNGDGAFFSLMYGGRPIIFYEGHRYKIKFNFKVERGQELPFRIGWWVKDGKNGYLSSSLPLTIRNLRYGWKEAECSYRFVETHFNSVFFLNSLQDYSTVNITNVEVVDLDRDDRLPLYEDQIEKLKLKNKGVWQKLTIKAYCEDGKAPVYLYFSKKSALDFSKLKGCVIFAYPEYKIIKQKDTISVFLKLPYNYNLSDSIDLIRVNNSSEFLSDIPSDKQSKSKMRPISFKSKGDYTDIKSKFIQLSSSLFPPFRETSMLSSVNIILPSNILFKVLHTSNWDLSKNLFNKDTTYYGYMNDLIIEPNSNKIFGPRVMRWKFALLIFEKEYNWKQKILGGGFNFLNWFGYRFLNDKKAVDYPHNPFLSILLYSGIFGLIIYLVFFYKAVYYYIMYSKEYPIILFFFIITFFFSFFSSGSPFDPPVMGFFSILPFFIHYIHKKSEQDQSVEKE